MWSIQSSMLERKVLGITKGLVPARLQQDWAQDIYLLDWAWASTKGHLINKLGLAV